MILTVNILLMLKVIATVGQHQHGSHGNSLDLDTLDQKTQDFIVSEDDILLEEIIASAKNVAETLFDADVPGKLGISSTRTRRRRRQVSQDDIKEALTALRLRGAHDVDLLQDVEDIHHGVQPCRGGSTR